MQHVASHKERGESGRECRALQFDRGYLETVDFVHRLLNRHHVLRRPVPVRRICEENGIRIQESTLPARHSSHDTAARIIHVRDYGETRKRFYIAQELGHFLFPVGHHAVGLSTFAGCLLIPHDWILQEAGMAAYPTLAQIYDVTGEVMRIRLEELGLIGRTVLPF